MPNREVPVQVAAPVARVSLGGNGRWTVVEDVRFDGGHVTIHADCRQFN